MRNIILVVTKPLLVWWKTVWITNNLIMLYKKKKNICMIFYLHIL